MQFIRPYDSQGFLEEEGFLAQEDATCGSSTECCLLVHKASYASEQVHTATEKAALAAEAAPAETLAEEPAAAASALAFEAARPAPISAERACDLPAAPPALERTSEGISLMHTRIPYVPCYPERTGVPFYASL